MKFRELMELRVDYHFHPNLKTDETKAIEMAHKWWETFREVGVNTLLVTEHVYKNPKRAYEIMKSTQPEEMYCFPGLEYLTSEGVDLIMFSRSDSIYDYPELTPYNLTYEEAIAFIETHEDIYGFVTHPYVPSKTGIIKNLGYEKFQYYVKRLGSLEIVSVGGMQHVIKFLHQLDNAQIISRKVSKKHRFKLQKSMVVPEYDYHIHNLKFIAVGSDAHHFSELGNYLEVTSPSSTLQDIFNTIITSKDGKIHMNYHGHLEKRPHRGVIRSSITVFKEYLMKQPYRFKIK
ncbi:MAG: hypothetical protein NTX05_00925 [Fusobacteria bacterium]|nr:hypothetical protein [Fusobacteriota bacterium]